MSNPLENYLHQLRSQLKGLPRDERESEIEEARQHLTALIEERIKAGESQSEAAARAIQQFGTPQENGKQLKSAWKRGNGSRFNRFLASTHFLLAALLTYSALTNALACSYLSFRHLPSFAQLFDFFPTQFYFQDWGSNPLRWFGVCALLGGFAIVSLRYPAQMRTPFFLAFTVFSASVLSAGAIHNLYFPPFLHMTLADFLVKIAALVISSFALCLSLKRDKSLFASPPQRRRAR